MKHAALVAAILMAAKTAISAVTLGEALDTTNLTWTTGGQIGWSTTTSVTHDGVDAARSGATNDNSDSWIQTQIVGPGVLTFWWKVSSEVFDTFEFYLGTNLQDFISGEVNWNQGYYPIPPGTYTVRWRYTRDSTGTSGQDAAWLDQVVFSSRPSLAESVDTPWLSFSSGGDTPWAGQTVVSHDGSDAAESGPITASFYSWMETTVNGPTTLRFWWKVSSEEDFDFLRFYINAVEKKVISGEVGWIQETFELPPGPQTLRWQYDKDTSGNSGQDKGWVDGLTVGSGPPLILATPRIQPDHSCFLRLSGIASGTNYRVQISSNLVQWSTLLQFVGSTPEISIVDSTAATASARFYRAISP
jgi:hypothetical protein